MKAFRGQLCLEGKVVLDGIHGTVRLHRPMVSTRLHPPAWSGDFELPMGRAAQAGGPYELRLSDGRIGRILVQRSAVSLDDTVRVDFLGCGPLRRPGRN